MTDWQDISTAPRDGTVVLIYSTTEPPHYADQSYIETICEGRHVNEVQAAKWIAEDGQWEQMYIGTPLYWMPLPLPPDDDDWGCEYCRNDGRLVDDGSRPPYCPKCDAEFEDEEE